MRRQHPRIVLAQRRLEPLQKGGALLNKVLQFLAQARQFRLQRFLLFERTQRHMPTPVHGAFDDIVAQLSIVALPVPVDITDITVQEGA